MTSNLTYQDFGRTMTVWIRPCKDNYFELETSAELRRMKEDLGIYQKEEPLTDEQSIEQTFNSFSNHSAVMKGKLQWFSPNKAYFWTTKQRFLKALANQSLARILNLCPDIFKGRRSGVGKRWAQLYAVKLFASIEKEVRSRITYQSKAVYKTPWQEDKDGGWRRKDLSQCVRYFESIS